MEEDILSQRLQKLDNLEERGIFPFSENQFPSSEINEVLESYQENREVSVCARVFSLRQHGKSIFFDIGDFSGRIQCYAKKDILGEEAFAKFNQDVDIGDFIGVSGQMFKTRTGQITVGVKEFVILSKSLRPLPEKWHGLKDVELRFRKRSLDLVVNSETRDVFLTRVKAMDYTRKFLQEKGYLEVETPMLQSIPGGARGRPFKTHHNALDIDLYLRIAPELFLKKLLVGGMRRVYEIGRTFRNEGISTRHNPEFTMLEAYCAYTDYNYMMDLTEDLISSMVNRLYGSYVIEYQGKKIDFSRPWKRISFSGILEEKFGIKPDYPVQKIAGILKEKGKIKSDDLSRSQLINLVEEIVQEYTSSDPVFVIDYYSRFSALAKPRKDNPFIAERFELFAGGMEVANAYSELNDPRLQRKNFQDQVKNDDEAFGKIDESFLEALEYGMPPASGLGIGMDRLVMLLSNKSSIKEVILFPLLKPQD